MAIQFNTLRYVETLKSAGVPEAQAKAEAEALATALGESASGTLATKDDVTNLKIEMGEVKSDLKLVKWMLSALIAIAIANFAKQFF
jgi:hypothetical protein